MAKSLQEQLLAAGLVDKKKAKKAAKELKQQDHLQRTGQANAIAAQIKQLVQTNRIESVHADIKYQFVDGKKVKSIYVDQAIFDRLSRGQLAIISLEVSGERSYQVIPLQIADKIKQRNEKHFIYIAENTSKALDEDDPYAGYEIPDDLMW